MRNVGIPEDKRPMEVTLGEPNENEICIVSLRFFGVKSAIPYTRKIIVDDQILKFARKKLTYSSYEKSEKFSIKYK